VAFKQELKRRGFDAEGRRLKPDTQDSAPDDGIRGNLGGTVNIFVSPTCLQAKYSMVQMEMKTLVDALMQKQQKRHREQARPKDMRKP
jgi:hypothetical protein